MISLSSEILFTFLFIINDDLCWASQIWNCFKWKWQLWSKYSTVSTSFYNQQGNCVKYCWCRVFIMLYWCVYFHLRTWTKFIHMYLNLSINKYLSTNICQKMSVLKVYWHDPPKNCHLTVKKLPKTWHFFKKNCQKFSFFSKKLPKRSVHF